MGVVTIFSSLRKNTLSGALCSEWGHWTKSKPQFEVGRPCLGALVSHVSIDSMFNTEGSFNVLYTTDIEKSANFFKKLGIPLKQHEADKVVVTFGSFELHYILSTTEPFEEYKYITLPEYGQGVIFYIETTDIARVAQHIPEAGGVLKSSIFENKWDCKELLAEDPNGYKFAFYQA